MIGRIWHSWTTPANAEAYQRLLCTEVVPAIEARAVAGLLQIDVLRCDHADEVEFTIIMAFDSVEATERYTQADSTAVHLPPAARPLLTRYDEHAVNHMIVERRVQPEPARGRP